MNKTIAQQLNITDFPFTVEDKDGNRVYWEDSDGWWEKREFDDANDLVYSEDSDGVFEKHRYDDYGNQIYFERSTGYWEKRKFDAKGNEVYFEDSIGYWEKRKLDAKGNEVYHEDSDGTIIDKRPKSKAIDKVAKARKLLKQAEKELKEAK